MQNGWIGVILSAIASAVSGLLLLIVKSHYIAETEWRKRIERDIKDLREKDEHLGTDIQQTRGAVDWLCGKSDLSKPTYGSRD